MANGKLAFSTSGNIAVVGGYAGPGGCRIRTRLNGVISFDRCTWILYAYDEGVKNCPNVDCAQPHNNGVERRLFGCIALPAHLFVGGTT